MSDSETPSPGSGSSKTGHAVAAGSAPKEDSQSTASTGTRSFSNPPDTGGSPPKSGASTPNPPEEQVTEQ